MKWPNVAKCFAFQLPSFLLLRGVDFSSPHLCVIIFQIDSLREAFCLHLGSAGKQIGNACWEVLCLQNKRILALDFSGQPWLAHAEALILLVWPVRHASCCI